MNVQQISDLQTPIGEIHKAAEASGVVIQADDQEQYALPPLDDELLDFLPERNPITDEERSEFLPGGLRARFDNRVGWARTDMRMAGSIEGAGSGKFRITSRYFSEE